MNVNDREWDGNCPQHKNTKLQLLQDLPKTCPRCGGTLEITEEEAIEPEREENST